MLLESVFDEEATSSFIANTVNIKIFPYQNHINQQKSHVQTIVNFASSLKTTCLLQRQETKQFERTQRWKTR